MILVSALFAFTAPSWFPFVIPWDDATRTVTDLSYLNASPAGRNGRIVARDGHFVEAATGNRVRFLAVDIVGAAAFKSHDDAEKTAAHLAKLGVNLVRFHHLQASWAVDSGGSIWKKRRVYLELDPVQLDKLDFLFAAFKRHGIYSNLNLQTTRLYVPEMGFPKSVLKIPFELDKRIDKVDRKMIQLQKQYASGLLDRTNPYTGLRYRDDPSLAFVEINNENSLVGWPGEPVADQLNSLPEPFRQEVVTRWNEWLAKRYGGDANLKSSWSKGLEKLGPSVLTANSEWSTENQSNGDVRFEIPNPNQTKAPGLGEVASFRATVNSNSGPDWHVQLHLTGLELKEGHGYTLRFRARCSKPGTMTASAVIDQPDWHGLGLAEPVQIGADWRNYAIPFTANGTVANHNRIGFAGGALRGVLEVEGLSLSNGVDAGPLLAGSLEKGNIPLPKGGIHARTDDFYRFLTETETAYSDEMRTYLRKDLGIKANLIDTQVAWGGISSLVRERGSDYADNHSYWQHPSFPGQPWDSNNWNIGNTPMVDAILDHADGLTGLARFRFAGKPYTISEYNHPAPSDYRVEMMPLLASFAALQDWDALYLFEYGDFGTGKNNDQIGGYFDVGLDPVRAGFFPSAALIFRSGFVSPLEGYNLSVVSRERAVLAISDPWSGRDYDPLTQRIAISIDGTSERLLGGSSSPVKLVKDRDGAIFTIQEPKALVVVGHVANHTVHLKSPGAGLDVTFAFGEFGRGFGAATVTPIRQGGYLLTIGSRAENQEMGWNAQRTTVGPNWGHGPVQAEGVPCDLRIGGVPIRHAWSLDSTGKRLRELSLKTDTSGTSLSLASTDQTIWYELTK